MNGIMGWPAPFGAIPSDRSERDGHGEPPADDCNAERDFRGEKLSNETRASCTDPDARLTRKRIENGGVTVERTIG